MSSLPPCPLGPIRRMLACAGDNAHTFDHKEATMKVDTALPLDLSQVAEAAKRAEALGYDGEGGHATEVRRTRRN